MLKILSRYRQRADHDCAIPLVQGVLHLLRGERRSRKAIIEALRPSEIDGTHPAALEHFFRREGLRVLAGEMSVEDLRYFTRSGRPVLCLLTVGMMGHWVAVVDVRRGRVIYYDPEAGASSMDADTFSRAWVDYDRRTEYPHYALCVSRG